METIEVLGAFVIGYGIFRFFSRPQATINKKFPQIKIWFVQLFPRLKIQISRKFIHIHHWIYLSAIFAFLVGTSSFAHLIIIKGLLLGGAVQGFMYKDRFSLFEDTFGHQQAKMKARQSRASGPKQ